MGAMASQIIGVLIVYSTVCSDVDQRNIKALRYWPLWGEFNGKRWIPRTREMFPFDDAIAFQYRKYTWNTPLQNFGDFVLAYKCYATEIIIWTRVLKTHNTVVCGGRLFQCKNVCYGIYSNFVFISRSCMVCRAMGNEGRSRVIGLLDDV